MFESFANSERYKTSSWSSKNLLSLRALLIQKDTKPRFIHPGHGTCLRALLIQKDTKRDRIGV